MTERRTSRHRKSARRSSAGHGPRACLDGGVNYEFPDSILNLESHSVNLEQFRILLENGVLRFGQNPKQSLAVQSVKIGDDRQTADNLRDETVSPQILSIDIFQEIILVNDLLLGCAVPITCVLSLWAMRRSIPSKAPPQMNRMFCVFTWMNSCSGCLRPPFGGTLMTLPSRSFSIACWTPSPETSRVMDGLSLLRAILSISSMNTIPLWP